MKEPPTAQTGLALPLVVGTYSNVTIDDANGEVAELHGLDALAKATELVRIVNAHTELRNALQSIVSIWESEERNESVTLNRYIREAKELLAKSTGQTQV